MKDLKYGIFNRFMVLAILVATGVLCLAYYQNGVGWKTGDVLSNIALPMALSGFTPFACLFPMLPCSLRFCEEYNSGYLLLILMREKKCKYIWSRIITTEISGGLMMTLAFTITFVIALVFSVPTTGDTSGFYEITIWYPLLHIIGGKLVLLLKIGLAFLFGAVWSGVCLLISVIITNRYVSFIGTFVLYQLFWQILSGNPLNPVYLLRGDNGIYVTGINPGIIQLVILLLVSIFSAVLMQRKLRYV